MRGAAAGGSRSASAHPGPSRPGGATHSPGRGDASIRGERPGAGDSGLDRAPGPVCTVRADRRGGARDSLGQREHLEQAGPAGQFPQRDLGRGEVLSAARPADREPERKHRDARAAVSLPRARLRGPVPGARWRAGRAPRGARTPLRGHSPAARGARARAFDPLAGGRGEARSPDPFRAPVGAVGRRRSRAACDVCRLHLQPEPGFRPGVPGPSESRQRPAGNRAAA